MTPRFHPLRVAEVRRETPDSVSVRFDVPAALRDAYAFVQGQHVTLKARIDGEDVRRSYSICAGVDAGELRVGIRAVPGGRFSTWANTQLAVGDTLDVLTPDGRFHVPLDPGSARHHVGFAAGSGITPVLSIAATTLAREPHSRFTLVYANRRIATTMFLEDLQALKDRHLGRFVLITLFSREAQDTELFNGRLDAAKVAALADTLLPIDDIDHAFVCGPGEMIDAVESALMAHGLARERVHAERFGAPLGAPTPRVDDPRDAADAHIVVELDGVRRDVDYVAADGSILDAAMRAGLDLPYSCKGGMCSTCRGKVLEGEVRMDRNFSLEPAEVAAGFVLTCQAHPVTPRVVVSYDQR
ncbi:MAG: phenylacetate-CoA oxygenase/reductase subunit PaaK [Burkholderiales bacterium]|nr:phenylacetate-CoA oxygenase/reductase subunit PaaK [Burkholderiales bacterium]